MRFLRARNLSRNAALGDRIRLADGWWSRLRGLLGRPPLAAGEGLLLVPCRSIHTFGMGYPIDVALLDRSGTVISLYPDLPPGKGTRYHRNGHQALELPAGTLAATGTVVGDRILLESDA